MLKNKNIWRA